MTSRQLILALVILIGIGILFTAGKLLIAPPPQGNPTPSPTIVEMTTIVASIGTRVEINGISVKPLEIVEDSRCAADVQCIQAGTVRLKAEVNGVQQVVTLNQPVIIGQKLLTLTKVEPVKYAQTQITPADYRFTFDVK